jgi:ligand-binding sensor domain-containing protein
VGTSNGLARLLADERHFEQYGFFPDNEHSLSGKNIINLFQDLQNNLWIATDRGLSLYQPETNNFKSFFIDPNESTRDINLINVIAQKNDNQLWIGNSQGLFVFDIPLATFKKHNIPLIESIEIKIQDLDIDSQGSLWLATEFQGVYNYHPETHKIILNPL